MKVLPNKKIIQTVFRLKKEIRNIDFLAFIYIILITYHKMLKPQLFHLYVHEAFDTQKVKQFVQGNNSETRVTGLNPCL